MQTTSTAGPLRTNSRCFRSLLFPLAAAMILAVSGFGFPTAAAGDDQKEEPKADEPLPTIRKPWKRTVSKPSSPRSSTSDAQQGKTLDVPLGQWADLLRLVDTKKQAKGGTWKLGDAQLEVASAEAPARLMIPVAPKGSYTLKVEFTRRAEGMLGVILPVGSRQCLAAVNYQGGASGLDMIGGRRASDNPSTFQGALANDRRYTMEISVRLDGTEAAVTVTLDDRPFLFYRGPAAALALSKEWMLPGRTCLGLAAQSDVVFHSVKLRMTSGQASVLP